MLTVLVKLGLRAQANMRCVTNQSTKQSICKWAGRKGEGNLGNVAQPTAAVQTTPIEQPI